MPRFTPSLAKPLDGTYRILTDLNPNLTYHHQPPLNSNKKLGAVPIAD